MKVLVISANKKLMPDPVYPIGAAYLATICRDNGHTVETFDCNFKANLDAELRQKIDQFKPEVIGISMRNVDNTTLIRPVSFLPDYQQIMQLCRSYSKAKIILGGSGFSLFPDEFFQKLKPDYGVVGNAEHTILELLDQIASNSQVETIIYARDKNGPSPAVIPDRSFFDLKRYYNLGGLIGVQTQRGCTFKCSYCTYPFLEGYRLVSRPAESVADEFQYLTSTFGINYFFIVDSVFNHSERHLLNICNALVKRNLRVKWSAYLRPQFKNPEIFPALKEAGCKSIELGTDALAEATLRSFAKDFTVEEVFNFCQNCREVKIAFCHSLIFGAPGETKETVQQTIGNVTKTKPTAILAFIGTRILPNTMMATHCAESGYIDDYASIGIEPLFYVEPNLDQDWLFQHLKGIAAADKRWIIPGLTTPKIVTQKLMRLLNKRGLLWEFKKYATLGQRIKEKFTRN